MTTQLIIARNQTLTEVKESVMAGEIELPAYTARQAQGKD